MLHESKDEKVNPHKWWGFDLWIILEEMLKKNIYLQKKKLGIFFSMSDFPVGKVFLKLNLYTF